MRGPIVRISAVILAGLALAVGAGWCANVPAQPGETVPDEVAATLRGGDVCLNRIMTTCANGVNPDRNGHDCRAEPVVDININEPKYFNGTKTLYCGGTQLNCGEYWNKFGAKCATSGAVTATPE